MMQTARCEADLETTQKVATAVDDPMRVWKGPERGQICCPCGTVIELTSKERWPHLSRCEQCMEKIENDSRNDSDEVT